MSSAVRRSILAVVTVVVLLALGAGVAVVVTDALGIRAEPAVQMQPEPPAGAPAMAVVAPPRFTSVDAPNGPRYDAALDELLDAVTDAPRRGADASLTVTAGDDPNDESYRLEGDASALTIVAAGEAGAVLGIYDVAARIRAGEPAVVDGGAEVTSRLPFRMVDLGAVGVVPDAEAWAAGTDYSHASRAFEDVILPEAPYIDEAALAEAYGEFDAFLRHVLADGYNAVAFPGFVEYVTFDGVDGVYAEGDDHAARALALREAFTPFWERADELGMDVFLRTDMLALTSPLEHYLVGRFGSLDTANPALWDVYTSGLDELHAAAPAVDGILIRIGEAGEVYDVAGWDVFSRLAVTEAPQVQAMLAAFTSQAEASDREVIFRSWSVGVGAVGDMHTNVESYDEVHPR